MPEKKILVKNPHGLHARPAALFVQTAAAFAGKVRLVKGEKSADAKSILSVMGLGVEPGSEVTVEAEGEGAQELIISLSAILENENI